MEQMTLTVYGMSCGHCVNAIESSVGKMNGVSEVYVHLNQGKVEIHFNSDSVSIEELKEVIEEQGYEVV